MGEMRPGEMRQGEMRPGALAVVLMAALAGCAAGPSDKADADAPDSRVTGGLGDTTPDISWIHDGETAVEVGAPGTPSDGTGLQDPGGLLDGEERPQDDAEGDADPGDGGAGCECGVGEHCDADGACVPNVCLPGQITCASLEARRICDAAGAESAVEACAPGTLCFLGQCAPPVCEPGAPTFCDAGVRMGCNGLGTAFVTLPCPAGTACLAGACEVVRPNVILIMDTSGSMSLLFDDDSTYPDACQGQDGCPVWEWPACDTPWNPLTRLGRAKQALNELVASDAAQTVRLALQRFPEVARKFPNCKSGWTQWRFEMSGDIDQWAVSGAWFEPHLGQILAVPFSEESEETDTAALSAWIDFSEAIGPGESCNSGLECATNTCYAFGSIADGKQCQVHTDPELRGDGPTPLGKSLFYAGEYLRRDVLVEGKSCETDADCRSPHHTCVDGTCHDPFFACRQTYLILFTDGMETQDPDPETFFNPRVQAKRLRYGLDCESDTDCAGQATCQSGRCWTGALDQVPDKMCQASANGCETDADCPAYACGQATLCAGQCEPAKVAFDTNGQGVLRDAAQHPLSITTHVVDASGLGKANTLVALNGGGQYISVGFDDVSALAAELLGLLDAKSNACAPSTGP